MTAFALPYIKRRTPITVSGNSPVLYILQPVAETALAYAFGNPVNGVVIAYKVFLYIGHLYKPRFARIVNKRRIAAPAEGIFVLEFRRVKEQTLTVKVFKHHRIGILYEYSCIRCFICKVALAVNKLNKGKVILSAYPCVILTESGRGMNDTGTVGHGDIAVTGYIMALFILLFAYRLNTFKQRLIFPVFKLRALKAFKYLVWGRILTAELSENLIKQSLCHIVGITVRRLYLAVYFIGVNAKSYIRRKCPRSSGPCKEICVLALSLKAYYSTALLNALIALCHLV